MKTFRNLLAAASLFPVIWSLPVLAQGQPPEGSKADRALDNVPNPGSKKHHRKPDRHPGEGSARDRAQDNVPNPGSKPGPRNVPNPGSKKGPRNVPNPGSKMHSRKPDRHPGEGSARDRAQDNVPNHK